MRKTREQVTLRQKLGALALLAQCQAELALQLSQALPRVGPRRRYRAPLLTGRRPAPKRR